ncbi:MAG: alanine dehydrogenase [Casimicrobiaceae bacterium]
MRIGVPRERKDGERRVGLVPEGVAELARAGHDVAVEQGAGEHAGFADAAYAAAGAQIVRDTATIFQCELVVKVKEPQRAELALLVSGTTLCGFAQFGRDRAWLAAALAARIGYIAYETVADTDGGLPLLAPMSRIAGALAPLIAANLLTNDRGGSGVLLPAIADAAPATVLVLGAGNVGATAAGVAARLGCRVTVLGRGERRLQALRRLRCKDLVAVRCEPAVLGAALIEADVVIGAVLEPGALSPKLISRAQLRTMRPGSVFIDVGIDQGGIAETSRMTSLWDPTYVEEGVVHYCVPNMPALVARTATLALTRATLPYVLALAGQGIDCALAMDPGLRAGLQVRAGRVTHRGLAADTDFAVDAR